MVPVLAWKKASYHVTLLPVVYEAVRLRLGEVGTESAFARAATSFMAEQKVRTNHVSFLVEPLNRLQLLRTCYFFNFVYPNTDASAITSLIRTSFR